MANRTPVRPSCTRDDGLRLVVRCSQAYLRRTKQIARTLGVPVSLVVETALREFCEARSLEPPPRRSIPPKVFNQITGRWEDPLALPVAEEPGETKADD